MPRTLLLADDSITIQKMVAITFQNEDYTVTAVDNGEDALARARELKPDIILADVVMPRRNGYELCQAIKSDPALRSIPVLLLAGTFEAFDEGKAVASQANGHIVKPFDSQVLLDRVTSLVTGQPMPVAAAPAPLRPLAPMPPLATVPAAPPSFAMPRPPAAPGFTPAPPPRPMPQVPGAGLPPLSRPPPAPSQPPAPFIPGAVPGTGLPPVAQPLAPNRPPFVGTPTPMLIPGGLPPVGAPPAARPGFSPPPANQLSVPAPAGINIGGRMAPTRPPTSPPRPMSLTPAPWAVSSSPITRPVPGMPAAPAPQVPRSAGTVAWTAEQVAAATPAPPAPIPQRARPTPTPMWGVSIKAPLPAPATMPAPVPVSATPAPPNVFIDSGLSGEVDVAMDDDRGAIDLPVDDTPLEIEPASSIPSYKRPTVRASSSAQLDISEMPEESIRTSSLADLAQGSNAPVGEIEIDSDGSPGDETELASAHEFLPPAVARPAPITKPAAPPPASSGAAKAADGGEGALRAALSQASRDVIEKIAWEVVPQLAEVIIREHVERLVRERSPK